MIQEKSIHRSSGNKDYGWKKLSISSLKKVKATNRSSGKMENAVNKGSGEKGKTTNRIKNSGNKEKAVSSENEIFISFFRR